MGAVEFFVPGLPATKGSIKAFPFKRKDGTLGANATNDNPKAKAWAAVVRLAAERAMAGRPPLEGPVVVDLWFYLPRPQSHYGAKGLKPRAPAFPTNKPDGDKMVRCLWDALTGVVFGDDSQIVEWPGGKRYAEDGRIGARITVRPMAAGVRTSAPPPLQRELLPMLAPEIS